jgi:hypothetical protein
MIDKNKEYNLELSQALFKSLQLNIGFNIG